MSSTIATWSVPGCIWSSRGGKPIDPIFDRRTEAGRLTLWHVLEPNPEYYPGSPSTGRHHALFPNEAAARAYADTLPGCKVYPHDAQEEARRQTKKRGPGRPAGSRNTQTMPDEARRKGHEITVTDEAWDKAQVTGNASQYIERLILGDK